MSKIVDIKTLRRGQYRNVCECYKFPNHKKINYTLDDENKIVFCNHCGNIIDPFVALKILCQWMDETVYQYERIREHSARIYKIARKYKPHKVAMKEIEKEMGRKGEMLPCCPHCGEPFELEEITRYMHREYAKQRKIFSEMRND